MHKIICITPVKHIKGVEENLSSLGEVDYCPYISKSSIKKILKEKNYDVIFTNPNKSKFVLNGCILSGTSIKHIITASTGINHIDIDFCRENGIKITSLTKEYGIINNISSTAEHAFALMMSLIRNIPKSFDDVKNKNWDYEKFIGRQMDKLSIGVVGYGRLGRKFAKYCNAFGSQIYICDPYVNCFEYKQIELSKAFEICDVISLHVHVNTETTNLINRKLFNKKGIYIINTSRGQIVNEEDIIYGLRNEYLSGYATDVLRDEFGNISNSKLIEVSNRFNIIITPHIGGMTREAQEMAYNGIINIFKGKI